MSETVREARQSWSGPAGAICLSGAWVLFLAAFVSDLAYAASFEIQWNNFASWLLVGALVLSGLSLASLAWHLRLQLARERVLSTGWLAAGWLIGFLGALMHARDAWASMPAGLWMSAGASVCVGVAVWLFYFSQLADGDR